MPELLVWWDHVEQMFSDYVRPKFRGTYALQSNEQAITRCILTLSLIAFGNPGKDNYFASSPHYGLELIVRTTQMQASSNTTIFTQEQCTMYIPTTIQECTSQRLRA